MLLTSGAQWCVCQTASHAEARHLAFDCGDVAEKAAAYLSEHGVSTLEEIRAQSISVVGRESEPITAGSLDKKGGRKLKPWTDANGNRFTDFTIYWTYAARETGDKLPVGMWRIRLAHYEPRGRIKLRTGEGGCDVEFQLSFKTRGANVIAILPLDSSWGFESNGRMERDYLDGITTALEPLKAASHTRQPPY